MKKLITSVFVLLMAISLIGGSLIGCSGTKTTTSTTSALKEVNVLIGVTSPLTGGAAPYGLGEKHGVEMAFEDLNNAGGLTIGDTHYTFTVKSLDDAYDPTKASDNIRTFVYQDGSKLLFTFESASELALAPTLAQQKVIQFVVVSDDQILAPTNTYTFRLHMAPTLIVDALTKWIMTTYPNVKKMAHFAENNVTGSDMEKTETTAWVAAGGTVTDKILFDAGTNDFMPFLTRILANNPDVIALGGSSVGTDGLIVKQARSMGYKGLFTQISPAPAADMIDVAGKDNLEGFISTNVAMVPPMISQKFIDLPAREQAKYGIIYGVTWDFYSQALIMIEAMKRAQSVDPTAIKNILEDTTQVWPYEMLVGGNLVFGSATAEKVLGTNLLYTHQGTNSYVIAIIKNGEDTNGALITP